MLTRDNSIMRLARHSRLVAPLAATLAWGFASAADTNAENAPSSVPQFEGLGDFGREVTTASPDAQDYFNQGLCFLYAFNHDEAIRSFRQAAELDPACAMAWWGISLANGPHINNPLLPPERAAAAWDALQKAQATAAGASAVEQELIAALAARYAEAPPEDRAPLDAAYAEAMRSVWSNHADDPDVGALFAEALMDLRPWDLWTSNGQPQPGTEKIVATLEAVLAIAPRHPLALHLYIHAVEASPHPERADAPADRLRALQPGLGHLVHMPSHIDVRRGRWWQAAETNLRAIEADRAYRERSPEQGFYRVYMAHNHHMLAFADMMQGRSERAIAAIHDMAAGMPAEWIEANAGVADGFTAAPLEALVRFGRWEEVLAAPEPSAFLPLARALRHCARGIACAAQRNTAAAREEQQALLVAQVGLPEETVFGNNKGADLLGVAAHLLAGEILYAEGKLDESIAELRLAVEREDGLRYNEPPDWIHPVRHPLGAILLRAGRLAEAEEVYRADLAKLPENGWSLFGLAQSLKAQGKAKEAADVMARFEHVWADADFKLTSSCLCVPGE
jgi:tetratricopeptide (TPR) repeat protein